MIFSHVLFRKHILQLLSIRWRIIDPIVPSFYISYKQTKQRTITLYFCFDDFKFQWNISEINKATDAPSTYSVECQFSSHISWYVVSWPINTQKLEHDDFSNEKDFSKKCSMKSRIQKLMKLFFHVWSATFLFSCRCKRKNYRLFQRESSNYSRRS